ncbi:MAG: NAD(P)/FAD-dependent oxidoreductase, partial [Chloroflexi bacterium]|nr:NAD(P)/FAD-dependent oxidoreductase [Chloroflexota bacterium]
MSKKLPSMFWIFVAFIPWIIFWSLSGAGLWTAALTAGVIASLILNGWRASQRNLKTMEVITLIYFVIHFTITLIFNSPFFKDYGVILNSLTLALMAFGSMLAKSPFTYQYARDDWDKAYWGDPNFLLINQIISGVWGVIFVINAALGGVAVFALSGSTLLLTVILPNVLIGLGIFFSAKFPDWFLRIGIQRIIEAREPYKWQAPAFNDDRPTDSNTHDVIVIGSGIGGLTAAALLAKRGRKVIVFEQHFLAGGFCTSWERGVRKGDERWRYVFDAGVHDISGLGERGTVRHLLKQLEIEDRIEWKRTSHEYFLGSTHIKISHDVNEFVCQLGKEFPSEAENIKKFFAEMKCIYREMYSGVEKTGGIPRAPDTVEEMLAYPKENPHAYKWMDVKFGAMLEQFFSDAKLKELLSALTGYLSDDATKLTVGAMAPIFGYYFDGGFYPLGGSQAFADALVQVIEENGGTVRLRTPVDRIVIE